MVGKYKVITLCGSTRNEVEYARKNGAEEADGLKEHFAAESMYQYGMMLLDGLHGVPRDPITGKYWIDKAAAGGYEPAIKLKRKRWKQ